MNSFEMLFLLIGGHFLADYPLQGEFLAKGKNRLNPIPGIPFYHPLTAHASIHGLFVGLITGSVWLGIAETIVHWFTDDRKCSGYLSYNQDQAIHILCKMLWVGIMSYAF